MAIGGINASNVQRVMFQSRSGSRSLDGVAVVSSIIAATNPKASAKELRQLIHKLPPYHVAREDRDKVRDISAILEEVPHIVKRVGQAGVLSHNMINQVVTNFAANVALAMWVP